MAPLGALLLLGLAGTVPAPAEAPPDGSKKSVYLASKHAPGPFPAPPAAPGDVAERPIFLRHAWTNEVTRLSGVSAALLDDFLRCPFTGRVHPMPAALLEVVRATAEHFETRKVLVISGYRSPKYNLWLRKKGREVARRSQHTQGRAVDFRPEGAPIDQVYRYLLRRHGGGVGYYPVTRFVHVDLGRRRTWRGT